MRRALVALLALLGVVSLALGIAAGTVWSAADTATARASVKEPGLVVTTAPGLLEGLPGRVTVTAKSEDDAPVLLAIGHDRDVQAYVDGVPHTTLTGFDKANPNRITAEASPGAGQDATQQQQPQIPDPATSDLWVQTESGKGSVTLVREPDEQQGRWVLVATGDGSTAAPTTFTFTWPQEAGNPWTVPLVVIGIVLLVAAAVLAALFFWWYAIRPAQAPTRTEPIDVPATAEAKTGELPTIEPVTPGPATDEPPTAAVGTPTLTAADEAPAQPVTKPVPVADEAAPEHKVERQPEQKAERQRAEQQQPEEHKAEQHAPEQPKEAP
jgi:hypothetical protein